MIERYSRPEMSGVWSEERRLGLMLKVEEAFLAAIAEDKGIPAPELEAFRAACAGPLAAATKAKEASTGHDVIALLSVAAERLGKKAPAVTRFLHYGLTSSDILDTALALQLRESADLLIAGVEKAAARVKALARKHELTWMVGRTHGVHAEPITLGVKLAGWHAELLRNAARLSRVREVVSRGKLSGAVGVYSQVGPAYEKKVCESLGLEPEAVATQVVPRDRHAEFFQALALCAAAIERCALEIRHLQRTEVLELEEPFTSGQKGSSAMPHKRNPVLCENLCGLSRLIRSYSQAAVENIALWHERDISHSSVERVILPDACILLDFMLHRFAKVLDGLQVHKDRMKENLERSKGLVFSQSVLLKLVDAGVDRLKAYEAVQKSAMRTWKTGEPFQKTLAANPGVSKHLTKKQLAECFDLSRYKSSVRELMRRGGVLA